MLVLPYCSSPRGLCKKRVLRTPQLHSQNVIPDHSYKEPDGETLRILTYQAGVAVSSRYHIPVPDLTRQYPPQRCSDRTISDMGAPRSFPHQGTNVRLTNAQTCHRCHHPVLSLLNRQLKTYMQTFAIIVSNRVCTDVNGISEM